MSVRRLIVNPPGKMEHGLRVISAGITYTFHFKRMKILMFQLSDLYFKVAIWSTNKSSNDTGIYEKHVSISRWPQ